MTALAAVVGLFAFGCVAYVVVTYAILLAQRPTSPTLAAPLSAIARSALTELCVTLVLMPFWPLWLVLGAAYPTVEEAGDEATHARRPIVLLHGFGMTGTSWLVLGHRLARRGLGPLFGTTYFSLQSVRRSAEQLAVFVERARAQAGAERVDIIAHSMGGVVARYYLERLGGATRVGRLITIASPHRGTVLGRYGLVRGARQLAAGSSLLAELAAPASGVAYTSIWSRSDSMVIPQTSSSITPAGEDRVFDDLGHLSLLASRRVVDVIVERLTSPKNAVVAARN